MIMDAACFRRFVTFTSVAMLVTLGACGSPEDQPQRPPAEELQSFRPAAAAEFPNAPSRTVARAVDRAALNVEEGEATFYADTFEGKQTASGRPFAQAEMVAAHRAFPFGTRLRVTNLRNQRRAEVTVVDRGPYGGHGRLTPIIDLSSAAARELGFRRAGRARVRVEVMEWGP